MCIGTLIPTPGTESMQDDTLSEKIAAHPELARIAAIHGGMVEVAILRGDRIRAYDAVDRAFRTLAETRDEYLPPMTAATESIIEEYTANLLAAAGIETLGQLCATSEDQLMSIFRISSQQIRKIQRTLKAYGLGLRVENR